MFIDMMRLFYKAITLMLGISAIDISLTYLKTDGEVNPLMILLFFMGTIILTIWHEMRRE